MKRTIGLGIEVKNSKNKGLIGINGKIIDETKNSILIKYGEKKKRLLKNQLELVEIEGESIGIKELSTRPEERIK